jgi:hypothetical protein
MARTWANVERRTQNTTQEDELDELIRGLSARSGCRTWWVWRGADLMACIEALVAEPDPRSGEEGRAGGDSDLGIHRWIGTVPPGDIGLQSTARHV